MAADPGKRVTVVEVFHSLQGEGARVGTPNVFVRLAGCNLQCRRETHGFDCDTDFSGGRRLTIPELLGEMEAAHVQGADPLGSSPGHWKGRRWCILTGGEPMLQVDEETVLALKAADWRVAVETNGTRPVPPSVDYVAVSPKTAAHTMRVGRTADEARVVLAHGMALPRLGFDALEQFVSPVFTPEGHVDDASLRWCVEQVKRHAGWRLSLQTHKLIGVR